MKLDELLVEYKTPKKPKARPKKTLWFNVPQLWKHDLDLAHPNHKLYYNEEEETFYALDNDQQKCYGSWNGKKKVGVTFYQPRPRLAVISPRARISEYIMAESKVVNFPGIDDPHANINVDDPLYKYKKDGGLTTPTKTGTLRKANIARVNRILEPLFPRTNGGHRWTIEKDGVVSYETETKLSISEIEDQLVFLSKRFKKEVPGFIRAYVEQEGPKEWNRKIINLVVDQDAFGRYTGQDFAAALQDSRNKNK